MEIKKKKIVLIPVILALAIVPLITVVKRYNTGLEQYAWFSNGLQQTIDVFLYYKAYWLTLLAFIMVVLMGFFSLRPARLKLSWNSWKCPEMICLLTYLLFTILSAALSSNRSVAMLGGYEQWEGANVIFAYVVLLAYVYLVVEGKDLIRYITYAIIGGSFCVGAIGAFQYMHMDFFKTDLGKIYMSLTQEKTLNFTFNFPEGQSYSTLYNPNYIGSYVALVFPVLVVTVLTQWGEINKVWHTLAMMSACFNFVALVGSQSLTGAIGLIVSLVFALLYEMPLLVKKFGKKMLLGSTAVVAVLVVAVGLTFPDAVKQATDKLFHPKQDGNTIESMVTSKDGIKIVTVDEQTLQLVISSEAENGYILMDSKGNPLELEKNVNDGGMMVKGDESLKDLRFFQSAVKISGEVTPSVIVQTRYNYSSWNICRIQDEYKLINGVEKLDDMVEIPASGFKGNQYFGDKRGYIWSRTIPLLGKYLAIGSGPNTFTEVFPNDDYVGMNNFNYYGMTITKPHNMYLQTWVQTGLISLLAFLVLVGIYLVKSLKLYYKNKLETFESKVGFAIMLSVLGYVVTGIANDSSVTVAPLFWGMLGLGMAVNRYNMKKDHN